MDNNYEAQDTGMYYYTRPIGVYTFTGVFALSLIVQAATEGAITWSSFLVAILWGIMAWGFGNLAWAAVGDIITPYIHRDRYDQVNVSQQVELDLSALPIVDTPLQNPEHEFDRHVNRVINDHKLWARGMVILTGEEEDQLRKYIYQRWFSNVNSLFVPSYISDSLKSKMIERGLVSDDSLTTYGETIIPCKTKNSQTVDLVM